MKVTAFLAIGLACLLAALAFWKSTTVGESRQLEIDHLATQVALLQGQLDEAERSRPASEPSAKKVASPGTGKRAARDAAKLEQQVKDQGRANDNQWQEIDFLKAQQVFQKKRIDQYHFDLEKIRREQDEIIRELQQLSKIVPRSNAADMADLKRRVDDLYRNRRR